MFSDAAATHARTSVCVVWWIVLSSRPPAAASLDGFTAPHGYTSDTTDNRAYLPRCALTRARRRAIRATQRRALRLLPRRAHAARHCRYKKAKKKKKKTRTRAPPTPHAPTHCCPRGCCWIPFILPRLPFFYASPHTSAILLGMDARYFLHVAYGASRWLFILLNILRTHCLWCVVDSWFARHSSPLPHS